MVSSSNATKSSVSPSKPLIRQTSSTTPRSPNANALKLLSPNRRLTRSALKLEKHQTVMEHEITRLTAATADKKDTTDTGICSKTNKTSSNVDLANTAKSNTPPISIPPTEHQRLRRMSSKRPTSPIAKRVSQTTKRRSSSSSKSKTSNGHHSNRHAGNTRLEYPNLVEWKANTHYCTKDKTPMDGADGTDPVASTPLLTSQTFQTYSSTSSRSSSPTSGTFPFGFNAISTTNQQLEQQQQQLPDDAVEYFKTNKHAWGYLRSLTEGVKSYGLDDFGQSSSELNADLRQDERYPYTPSGFLIGSDPSCDIRIPNLESRHSFIYMRWLFEKEYYFPQLHILDRSNNGLLLDGRPVEKIQETNLLRHGYSPGENPQAAFVQNGQIIQLNGETPQANVLFQLHVSYQKIQCNSVSRNATIDDLYQYDSSNGIGKGAYGNVYRAVCRSTNKVVAIKRMVLNERPNNVIQALCREAAINVLLKPHPCIIQFKNVMEEYLSCKVADRIHKRNRSVYIIMEHGKDGDLFDLVNNAHPIPEDDVIVIFDQLFHAISHLHGQGIAHRDLKLENVIVTSEEHYQVKLCDFGVATFERTGHRFLTHCGTLEYSAPEILSSERKTKETMGYTKAVDIWSLGIMLYNTLSKSSPYPSSCYVKETMYQYTCGDEFPDFAGSVWHRVSDQAKDLIRNMLTVDPEQRFNIDQILAHPWAQRAQVLENRNASLAKYLNTSS